ncbi:uncharacterized protein LOC125179189 [Hyalella azteca]|nr:uncharacterized protein LOC125179189 [Hyalella azteca]
MRSPQQVQDLQGSSIAIGFASAEETLVDQTFKARDMKILGKFLADFAHKARVDFIGLCSDEVDGIIPHYLKILKSSIIRSAVAAGSCESVSSPTSIPGCPKVPISYNTPNAGRRTPPMCERHITEMKVYAIGEVLKPSVQQEMARTYDDTRGTVMQMVLARGPVASNIAGRGMMWTLAEYKSSGAVKVDEIYQFLDAGGFVEKFIGVWREATGMDTDVEELGIGPINFMGNTLLLASFPYAPYYVEESGQNVLTTKYIPK